MAATTAIASSVLDVRGLKTYFRTDEAVVKAVDDVSLSIAPGQTLGLVGESGSGKSVTSLSVMRLLPEHAASIEGGTIALLGRDLVKLPEREMRQVRGRDAAMIFQEPGTSLNPVYRVGDQVAEAIRLHQKVGKAEALTRTLALFDEVGIPDPQRRIRSFPHEMSGGQKQRVMIAMALSCNPKLLIADEPTTALDVTIQAQILDLLRTMQKRLSLALLLITHDLGVVAEMADRVCVMYAGRIVEHSPVKDLFADPKHPYTKGLLASIPGGAPGTRLRAIEGTVPPLGSLPPGCSFTPRCPDRFEPCPKAHPGDTVFEHGRTVKCYLHGPAVEQS